MDFWGMGGMAWGWTHDGEETVNIHYKDQPFSLKAIYPDFFLPSRHIFFIS
jgi:hypothetical protein